jgi:hypothetical protein
VGWLSDVMVLLFLQPAVLVLCLAVQLLGCRRVMVLWCGQFMLG